MMLFPPTIRDSFQLYMHYHPKAHLNPFSQLCKMHNDGKFQADEAAW